MTIINFNNAIRQPSAYGPHAIEGKVCHHHRQYYPDGSIVNAIRLQSLLLRLKMGQTLPEIKRDIPEIPLKALIHARAYFANAYPDLYKPHYSKNLRVLIDENVDPHFSTDSARLAFGSATHVSFLDPEQVKDPDKDYGAESVMDIEIWKYACAQRFNFIITKDRANVAGRKHLDLTRCALKVWKWKLQVNRGVVNDEIMALPRILHVTDASLESRTLSSLLLQHKDSITEIFEECSSPIIEVNRKSASPGKTFLEILTETNPKLEEAISRHTRRILSNMDSSHLPHDGQERVKHSIRNRVAHDMAGDFAAIPFSGKRQALIDDYLTKRIEIEDRFCQARQRSRYSNFRTWSRSVAA